jgi:hypothetical protein
MPRVRRRVGQGSVPEKREATPGRAALSGGVSLLNCDFAAWDPDKEMLTSVVGGDGAN